MKAIYALLACAAALPAHADSISPTRNEQVVQVKLVLFGSRKAVQEKCASLGVILGGEGGCTRFYLDTKVCEVYAAMPTSTSDETRMALVGHEVLHCFYGRYHDSPA